MAKLTKAKRGKNRWIGLSIKDSNISRTELSHLLEARLQGKGWKLFDLQKHENYKVAIIKTTLEDSSEVRDRINLTDGLSTITTSGKIRLVRARITDD